MLWEMHGWDHGIRHHVGMLKGGGVGVGDLSFPAGTEQIKLNHRIQSRVLH